MSTEYKPLFNRTYLKIVPWVAAIVIVILSANNSPKFPAPENIKNSSGYIFEDKNATDQAFVTYAVTPAYSLDHQIDREALEEIYSDNLLNSDLEITWEQDRVTLAFPLNKEIVDSLSSTLESASSYTSETYIEKYSQAKAAQYLSMNIPEELAIANFKNHLADNYRTKFSPFTQQPQVLFIVKDSDNPLVEKTLSLLKANHKPMSAERVEEPLFSPKYIQLKGRSEHNIYLLGQPLLAKDNNAEQLIALYYLHQSLQRLGKTKEVTYRIQRQPLTPTGYSFLLVASKKPFDDSSIKRLNMLLLDQIQSDELDVIKKRLVKQYENQISTADAKYRHFVRQLFYGEIIESPDAFRDRLNQISTDQVKTQIAMFLDPDHSIIVNLAPL